MYVCREHLVSEFGLLVFIAPIYAVKIDATRILFAGGVNGHPMRPETEMLKTVQMFDALTNAWSVLPPMPSGVVGVVCSRVIPRFEHSSPLVDGKLSDTVIGDCSDMAAVGRC